MTMPREIYRRTNSFGDALYHETKSILLPETKYYSQAVLDEKDARIKQLEKALRQASKFIYRRTAPNTAKLIEKALAGKGGSDGR